MKLITSLVVCILLLTGCGGNDSHTPKPRAYPRIEYPVTEAIVFDTLSCPFTFTYPGYAEVQPKKDRECWFDLYMPYFNARLHCSYLPVANREDFDQLVKDVYTIAYKINERANFMETALVENAQGVHGTRLTWTGPAASPMHFFLSDTTQHFFKAALYFDAEVQPDSLAPIIDFVKADFNKMIESFAWKNE